MNNRKVEKLKVVFTHNAEPVDQVVTDTLITQLMVSITRVGLRIDKHIENNDIIEKEN